MGESRWNGSGWITGGDNEVILHAMQLDTDKGMGSMLVVLREGKKMGGHGRRTWSER